MSKEKIEKSKNGQQSENGFLPNFLKNLRRDSNPIMIKNSTSSSSENISFSPKIALTPEGESSLKHFVNNVNKELNPDVNKDPKFSPKSRAVLGKFTSSLTKEDAEKSISKIDNLF